MLRTFNITDYLIKKANKQLRSHNIHFDADNQTVIYCLVLSDLILRGRSADIMDFFGIIQHIQRERNRYK